MPTNTPTEPGYYWAWPILPDQFGDPEPIVKVIQGYGPGNPLVVQVFGQEETLALDQFHGYDGPIPRGAIQQGDK